MKRRFRSSGLSLAGLACLTACGFHPLYGSAHGGANGTPSEEAQLAAIRVDTIADRQGQKLRNYLIDDLQGEGPPPPPEHDLQISYGESQADLGLNNDAITTRGQLTIGATFILKNTKTGKTELVNSAQQITGYNIQASEFATILSRDDAEDRALHAIADNIQLRLALYFRNKAEFPNQTGVQPPKGTTPPNAPATQGMAGAPPRQPGMDATAGSPLGRHAPGQQLDDSSPITQTSH